MSDGIRAVPAFELAILRAIHHSKGPKGLGSAGFPRRLGLPRASVVGGRSPRGGASSRYPFDRVRWGRMADGHKGSRYASLDKVRKFVSQSNHQTERTEGLKGLPGHTSSS
jgi:hypothetical protein